MRSFSKRIGVLGDVHCEDALVAEALALFRQNEVEAVLCVGDIVDGPGNVVRTIDLLREAGVEVVRGNHERWLAENTMRDLPDSTLPGALPADQLAWLNALPLTHEYRTPLGQMLLCHGMPSDDMATLGADDAGYGLENNEPVQQVLREQRYQMVLSGHSHRRLVRGIQGILFVNAGTLFREHRPCVGMLDLEARTMRYFDWKDGGLVEAEAQPLTATR